MEALGWLWLRVFVETFHLPRRDGRRWACSMVPGKCELEAGHVGWRSELKLGYSTKFSSPDFDSVHQETNLTVELSIGVACDGDNCVANTTEELMLIPRSTQN